MTRPLYDAQEESGGGKGVMGRGKGIMGKGKEEKGDIGRGCMISYGQTRFYGTENESKE